MKAININIHIDRIVLDGLSIPYHQQPVLNAVVEMELVRLFTGKGLAGGLRTNGAVSHISTDDIKLSDESDLNNLGQQIAQVVYKGVRQ